MLLVTIALLGVLGLGLGEERNPWWSGAVYYSILVDSFKDGDGDGLGDLKGVTKQISYVKALGADAIILSPISQTSDNCSNPGIIDFTQIDQRYGSLDEFNGLLEKAKKLELKVVITLPLQTISEKSDWFSLSAKRVNGYDDWLIWRDGEQSEPPPAPVEGTIESWIWNEERSAYYGSVSKETVLNLCSDGVNAALSAMQCAWLKRGVSGVILSLDLLSDPRCEEKLLKKMIVDAVSCARAANLGLPALLVKSSQNIETASSYYGRDGVGAHSIMSKALGSNKRRAPDLMMDIYADILYAPHNAVSSWSTTFYSDSRIATRYGNEMVDAINLIALILPGAAIIQQGDELGAEDTLLESASSTNTCWPISGAPIAAPFPWDDSITAGFTTGVPWLHLAPNYRYANAKTEFANEFSHVSVVRVAAAMRRSPAMGPHAEIKRIGDAVAILRWGDSGSLLLISNVGKQQSNAELVEISGLPAEMTVAASSVGSSYSRGSHWHIDKALNLIPGETVLLAGAPRHCGGPGPVDKIANKLSEGWQKINKYFSSA